MKRKYGTLKQMLARHYDGGLRRKIWAYYERIVWLNASKDSPPTFIAGWYITTDKGNVVKYELTTTDLEAEDWELAP